MNFKINHLKHIGVSDIDEVFDALKGEKFQPIEPEPVFLPFRKNSCKYFNISGPDGERIEFNQIL